MEGPEVMRMLTPISFAITAASVVLPRPGGPCRSTWSSGSPRILAAFMNTLRFSLTFCWPMYSLSVLGRSETSDESSGNIVVEVIYLSSFSSEKLMLKRVHLTSSCS